MLVTLLLVGLGGTIGSVARHLISTRVQRGSHSGFPWGTLAVNITGSFVIGIVFGVFDARDFSDTLLTFLVSGVLGGYTTFSTFSVENLKLLQNRRYGWFLQNAAGQIIAGLVAAGIGYALGSAVV